MAARPTSMAHRSLVSTRLAPPAPRGTVRASAARLHWRRCAAAPEPRLLRGDGKRRGSGEVKFWIQADGSLRNWSKSDDDSASIAYRHYFAESDANADSVLAKCVAAYKRSWHGRGYSTRRWGRVGRHRPVRRELMSLLPQCALESLPEEALGGGLDGEGQITRRTQMSPRTGTQAAETKRSRSSPGSSAVEPASQACEQ